MPASAATVHLSGSTEARPARMNRIRRLDRLPTVNRIILALIIDVVLILLFAGPAWPVEAASFPGSVSIPQPPKDQATFVSWLAATGRPVYSRYNGYAANYSTYKKYKMLVYGQPTQVPDNRYDSTASQYAYLGFSYDELTVTNSLFRDDGGTGLTSTSPWDWVELELGTPATLSWSRLSARQKTLIKKSLLTYRGYYYGGMTYPLLNFSELKTLVLTIPAWHLDFALYTRHYHPTNGSLRYATFNGFGGGSVSLGCSLNIENTASATGADVYDLLPDQDYLDIQYEVSGRILRFNGLAIDADIAYRGAGNDIGWTQGSGSGPWRQLLTRRVLRGELAGAETMSLTLSGSAWAVSQMGDIEKVSVNKQVTIQALPEPPPFTVDFDVTGELAYFANRTNLVNRSLPRDLRRFLGLERVIFSMTFSQLPREMTLTFLDRQFVITGLDGILTYQQSVRLPVLPSSLSWQGERLQPAYQASLTATAWDFPGLTLSGRIDDIEVTGDIHDIYHVQAG